MHTLKRIIRRIVPKKVLAKGIALYHFLFAWGGALWYGFPSKKLYVIAVTGTKGKSTTTEILNAILEDAGFVTALSNTIRFKIAKASKPNLYKMSMPGRAFLQHFLYDAKREGCTHVIMEMTSEGARQFRNRGIDIDALIFTNVAPEHIESHGSFENYKDAKRSIAHGLVLSSKRPRTIVANPHDELGKEFLALPVEMHIPFDATLASPYTGLERGTRITVFGVPIETPLEGVFNIENAMAAATFARTLGIADESIIRTLKHLPTIRGRVEHIHMGQPYLVIVDYAHTPDSLKSLYEAFPSHKKICVLGNTGGGRDTWKRPAMGALADQYCEDIILTNEDPYDEHPESILNAMSAAILKKKPTIILDRRAAIHEAILRAKKIGKESAVLITGKGTDPFIMGPQGTKIPWSDRAVAEEELIHMEKRTHGAS